MSSRGIDGLVFTLTFVAALGCGLMAGLFFAFSVAVMKALARLPSAEGLAAMQAINVAIINPAFLAAFFGTAAACALIVVASLGAAMYIRTKPKEKWSWRIEEPARNRKDANDL